MPSATFFLTFLRARAEAVCCSSCRVGAFLLAMSCFPSSPLCDLAGWHVHLDGGLARPLASTRVGPGTLPAYRQSLAMTHAAIAAEVHKPLDRHRHLAAQVAFHREAPDALADALELTVGKVLDLARCLHAGRGADRLRAGAADAEDRRQRDLGVLVVGDVDACYACHGRNLKLYQFEQSVINLGSSLPLLVARIRANHPDHAFAPHDLAFAADPFHRCHYFHDVSYFVFRLRLPSASAYLALKVIRPLVRS